MVEILARNWGWILLRGIVAILFGVFTLFNPGIALATLVLLFGAYALADGVLIVITAVANRQDQPRWATMLVAGILGIATGIITFLWPQFTAVALLAVIAVWAFVIGAAEIVAAIQLRKQLTNEWMLILAGVASMAFGVFLIARPSVGALAVVFWIGAYAVLEGTLLAALAFRLRSWGQLISGGAANQVRTHGARA